MRIALKTTLAALCGLGLSTSVSCAVLQPAGKVTVQKLSIAVPNPQPQLSPENTGVTLTAFVTGWVKAPANILIDQKAPNLPDELKQSQWVPSLAYAVQHPSLGVVIFDAGLQAGDCDYGLRPIYWVPCRNTAGQYLAAQLKQAGLEPEEIRYIIPSHFHGDHISGLKNLLTYAQAPLLMTSAALKEIRSPLRAISGIPSVMMPSEMRAEIMDGGWREDAELGESFDVFGDGSVKIFKTAGHTGGHISARVQTPDKTVLLAFDAAHIAANLDLGIPSGAVASQADALESLEMIRRLSESSPELVIVFGHEPAQWECSAGTRETNILGGDCALIPAP